MQDDSYIATVQEGSGEDANHNNDKNAGDRRGQRSSRFRMTAQPQYRRLLALQREIRKIRRGRRGRLRPERMAKMIS